MPALRNAPHAQAGSTEATQVPAGPDGGGTPASTVTGWRRIPLEVLMRKQMQFTGFSQSFPR